MGTTHLREEDEEGVWGGGVRERERERKRDRQRGDVKDTTSQKQNKFPSLFMHRDDHREKRRKEEGEKKSKA